MSWDDLLYETTKISAGLAEKNERLVKELAAAKKQIDILNRQLDHEKIKFDGLYRSVRMSVDCSTCNNMRWIWYTCGEGTCEMNDPCHECNGDSLLPMNWDATDG